MKKKKIKKTPPKNKETYMAVCPAVDPLWQQAAHARKKKKTRRQDARKKKEIGKKKKKTNKTQKRKRFVFCSVLNINQHIVCVCVCAISSRKKERNLREGDRLAASPFNSLRPSIEKDCVTNEEGSAGCQRDPSGL